MADLPPIAATITADTSDFDRGIKSAQKSLTGLDDSVDNSAGKSGKLGKGLAVAGAAAAAGLAVVGAAAVKLGSDAVSAASDLGETKSKVDQIFGAETGAQIQEWAKGTSAAIGQSQISALNGAATFATFGKAAGLAGSDLQTFSTDLVGLSSDLASFYNTSPEEALEAIGAGLRGEAEPLRKYGILMNDASLKQAYFEETGKKVTGALTPQQKVLAANALVWQQTADAQGDFARTSDGLANSQRTLVAVIDDVKASVGEALLPAITEITQAIGPLVQQLSGPLSEVAQQVGGALADAFKAIGPLLPSLGEALGKVAGVLGSALTTAIKALVPLITPLLSTFSALSERIGPKVNQIVELLARVLSEVLDAVLPLIDPLMDFVFTILDAAWPIIEIVAEALLTVVAALKPVLGAVSTLLGPLGQLINVLFAAILPVLKPILPLLEVLADLFANVLTRAIGLITAGIGYLIQGFAQLAPFVLNNVTIPVTRMFLTFAENIVGAAADAFGWIPGLGDKLNGAKTAISKFKDDTERGIKSAADTISKEGGRIGRELVDQGVNMMTSPESVNNLSKAGQTAGMSLADGMAVGIRNGQIPVQAASANLAKSADAAARAASKTKSPSQVWAEHGKDLTAGLSEGIKEGGEDVKKTIKATFDDWYKTTLTNLQDKLEDARERLRKAAHDVGKAITQGINFGAAFTGAKDRAQAIADAEAAYRDAAAAAAKEDATDSDKRALVDATADLEFAKQQGAALGLTFLDSLKAQAQEAQVFALKIRELIQAGLSREAIQQVLAAGATAGIGIADELITGGADAIKQANDWVAESQAAADEVGLLAGESWEGAGVKSAQDTYNGFKANFGKNGPARKALMKVMDNLAEDAARDVKINVAVTKNINEVVTRVVQEIKPTAARAEGGSVMGDRPYLVGERGPELFVPYGVSGTIVPNSGIGQNTNITVNASTNADPVEISREIAWLLKVGV